MVVKAMCTMSQEVEVSLFQKRSQWSIMGHNLWNYAVSQNLRSERINRWHYHLQMSIIPDESYFPSVAMNSPYA
ncbi:hypothetical protein SK128_007440 [Halocaridina rubra]|uniref:Uncharacterized protein n=1 Tax=Halocaridina rubra TaxID=373956 RepID=A0AAN8X385_HALRR